MQQISYLKSENAQLKAKMEYGNTLNLNNMSKADLERLQTHLSMNSLHTLQPAASSKSIASNKSSGRSKKSKSSIKSKSSKKSHSFFRNGSLNGRDSEHKSSLKKKRRSS